MTSERHALVKDIFLAVVSSTPDECAAILDQRCGDDEALRQEVERLVDHYTDETITPEDRAAAAPTEVWRQGEPQLDLDAQERAQSSPPSPAGQALSPGTVVGARYRIVSKLGSGGMGVVYRADDLTLGQTVALKFLNPTMAKNTVWLARFRNEVRLAREVTHPCVCRVYDIGDADERHFITMEYVDGEDLASLNTRIGRLPQEKALDIARQICIGLAAAHDAGVLHRDLKPANVMLDGRGQVRITDFGLAALPDEIKAGEIRAGTPAYMAPEQIAGREVTIQSDIYALGLVIYEVYAGRPAFEASTVEEFRELQEHARPAPLSDLVEALHPDVERIVDRCLQKQAKDRPRSALEVAAALPGGNLLAAALAANLTPTPEMVVAATPRAGQGAASGWTLAITLVLLAALVVERGLSPATWLSDGSRAPAVLVEQAQALIKDAGYTPETRNHAYGFCEVQNVALPADGYHMPDAMAHLAVHPATELVFWYRQSPQELAPIAVQNVVLGAARVTPNDPSPGMAGMVSVVFDLSGRLLQFVAIPEHGVSGTEASPRALRDRWALFFQTAGLDQEQMTATEPAGASFFKTDQRSAWQVPRLAGVDNPVHVEAMACCGRLLFFAVGQSDDDWPAELDPRRKNMREVLATTSLRVIFLVLMILALPRAWRNYRAGRSDRQGAMRLAIFIVVIQFVAWMLRGTHVADFNAEVLNICLAGLSAVGIAGILGIFYVALEPVARRYWPDMLITWSRALSLRLRDPILGQHLIAGVCVGCFWAFLAACERVVVSWVGWDVTHSLLADTVANNLLGGRVMVAGYLGAISYAIFRGMLFVLVLVVLRALLRRPLLAAVVAGVIIAPMVVPRGAHLYTSWFVLGVGGVGVSVWVMTRYGLLTLTVGLFVAFVLSTSPITFRLSAWYADESLYVLAVVTALAVYGFVTARAGRVRTLTS